MNRTIFTLVFAINLSICGFGQDSLDISLFSKPDMTGKLWQDFFNGDSILFVIPDVELSKTDSMVLFACKRSSKLIKESELKADDYNKKMHVWGVVTDFKYWDKFDMPINQTAKGFEYSGLIFENIGNSMFYINSKANRLAYIGNSIQAIDPIRRSQLGTYQIYIFNDNVIVFNGNENEPLNDLEKIRKEYFTRHINSKYFKISSGSLVVFDLYKQGNKLDAFIDSLAILIGINTQDFHQLHIYLYNHLNDVSYLSGMPSPWQMYGINVNNIAHASSLDLKTIKHETTHWLIHQKIGANSNNFYVEGFRQYTEYLFDSTRFKEDLKITKENTDLLTIKLINGDSQEFFSSSNNYPISGVFVHFLIELIGLDNFKQYYGKDGVNKLLLQNQNIDKDELIDRFKKWIQ